MSVCDAASQTPTGGQAVTAQLIVVSIWAAGEERVLKLFYKVASSHPPAPQILRVLKLYYPLTSSHLPTPQLLCVLKLYYHVASSPLPASQRLRVLKLYYAVASSQLPAPQIAPRTKVVLETRQLSASSSTATPRTKVVLHFALSPAFRVLDTHDLRRGSRAHLTNRALACVSRTRHARSPQRVAFSVDAVRPTLRL